MLLTTLNLLFLAVVIGIPIGANVLMSIFKTQSGGMKLANLTLEHYRELFHSSSTLLKGLSHSLMIAGVAALLGLLFGLCVAYVLTYSQFKFKRTIEVFSVVTLAVPGVVLGIGYIFVWNQKWLDSIGLLLYGTPWILVLAAIAALFPSLRD